MTVSATAFKRWLGDVGLPDATAPLARSIGVTRTTLGAQLLRGRVREAVVVAAARAAEVSPVDALATFEEFSDLRFGTRPPLEVEVLSQVAAPEALAELLARQGGTYSAMLGPSRVWEDPPHFDSVRNWIDAVDPGGMRQQLSARFGISPSNLGNAITQNKLQPRQLVEAARIAHTSLTSGLAAAGVLTLAEAGWPEGARSVALGRLRDDALIELVQHRLAGLHRVARRRGVDQDEARRIEDTLG